MSTEIARSLAEGLERAFSGALGAGSAHVTAQDVGEDGTQTFDLLINLPVTMSFSVESEKFEADVERLGLAALVSELASGLSRELANDLRVLSDAMALSTPELFDAMLEAAEEVEDVDTEDVSEEAG